MKSSSRQARTPELRHCFHSFAKSLPFLRKVEIYLKLPKTFLEGFKDGNSENAFVKATEECYRVLATTVRVLIEAIGQVEGSIGVISSSGLQSRMDVEVIVVYYNKKAVSNLPSEEDNKGEGDLHLDQTLNFIDS